MFQKVGDWLSDKSDRFIRGEAGAPGSYYASNEAEQAYGRMQANASSEDVQDAGSETARMQPLDSFERAGKDYGGRVPYKSQRDLAAEQQRQIREESQAYPKQAAPQAPQGYGQPAYNGYPQAQAAYPQQAHPQTQQQQAQPGTAPMQPTQANNVVPFPGMQRTPEGGVCTHIEYVVLLRSRNECKNVIEYIKANASVFLSMEFIASDSERQRCVDMLSGAAYTLGCALNRISPRGIYLISSPSVYVVIDPAIEKFGASPEAGGFARQGYEGGRFGTSRQSAGYQTSAYPQYPTAGQGRMLHEEGQRTASRFGAAAQGSSYGMQDTQRRAPATFGSVMAGNVTGTYQPANAFVAEDAQTARQLKAVFRQ